MKKFSRQIFEGIGFMHKELKLVHTDLKPENLLLKFNDYDVIKTKDRLPRVFFSL